MDKLKYIKLENEDGSYSSSIPLAVDSGYVDVNGTSLTNVLENTATKTEVQALASGSPAGVYETVAELTTADPDHSKVYVVAADDHWYYYNNGWQDGGLYQSVLGNLDKTLMSDNKIPSSKDIGEKLNPIVYTKNLFNINEAIDNYYYNSSGTLVYNANYFSTNLIYLKQGETVYASDYNNGEYTNTYGHIEKINKFDFSGRFIERVEGSATKSFYEATEDGFVNFTVGKSSLSSINNYGLWKFPMYKKLNYQYEINNNDLILKNEHNIEDISKQYNYFDFSNSLTHHYIDGKGTIVYSAVNRYFCTNPIPCKIGDVFYSQFFGDGTVKLFQATKYDTNKQRIGRDSLGSSGAASYTAAHNGYIIFNCYPSSADLDFENLYTISKNEELLQYYPFKKYPISPEIKSDVKIIKQDDTNYIITFGTFKVTLFKTVNDSTNSNNWNIKDVRDLNDNILVPTGTDILGPVKINDNTDFIGGVHGDETTDNITIAINNNSYSISDITSTLSGKSLTLIMKSTVYDQIATDQAFNRYITIIFTPNKMHISNTFKATKNLTLKRATNGGLIACRNPIIKDIIFNNSYYPEAPTTSVGNGSKTNTCATINTIYGSVTVNNIKGHENDYYMGVLNVFTNENPIRCKIYFDTYKSGNYSISTGDLITGEFEYIFS